MRYASKEDLLTAIRGEDDALRVALRIPSARYKQGGVWGDGWTIADLIAHLAEWQRLFLGGHDAGLKGTRR